MILIGLGSARVSSKVVIEKAGLDERSGGRGGHVDTGGLRTQVRFEHIARHERRLLPRLLIARLLARLMIAGLLTRLLISGPPRREVALRSVSRRARTIRSH